MQRWGAFSVDSGKAAFVSRAARECGEAAALGSRAVRERIEAAAVTRAAGERRGGGRA